MTQISSNVTKCLHFCTFSLSNLSGFVTSDMKFDKYIQFSYMNDIKCHKYHQVSQNVYTLHIFIVKTL